MLLTSISVSVHSEEKHPDTAQWKKLLHFGVDKSRVISKEFFLSSTGHTDYLSELHKTIRLVKSKHGRQIACNFPARYRWLTENIHDLPVYKLIHCPDLEEFRKSIQQKTVSLVFASEYLDNPVSSFGHTLLIFHDPDKPLSSADTIHFAARTDKKDGFIKYTWKGLTGGYPGNFFRDPFFKNQHKYNIVEQRYLHIYTLDLSAQQIETLIYHLYELRKATFNYYFINENCAFQIGNLLDIVDTQVNYSDSGFVLPIEVITKNKHRYKTQTVLYPSAVKLIHLFDNMSDSQQDLFESIVDGAEPVAEILSDELKYALALYYEYQFKKNNTVLPNYNKVMQLGYTKPPISIDAPAPLQRQGFSRAGIAYRKHEKDETMLLTYRPFLRDVFDTQQNREQTSTLSLFNTAIEVNHHTISLHQFDVLDINSTPFRTRFFKPVSWHFYSGFNRANPHQKLDYETEFGLGMTHRFSMLSLNYNLHAGVDMSSGDHYYKPNVAILVNVSDYFRFGLNAYEKYYDQDIYIERDAFASLSFEQYAVNARYSTTSSTSGGMFTLSIFSYFN